jgi:hypothetical protein
MKQILTLLLLMTIAGFSASAQWINGLTVSPANPTTGDNISIIANLDFPSGGCADKSMSTTMTGNNIALSALHCVGMAAYICNSVDTFQLGLLPAGTYTATLQVNMGAGPSPCTPGINPGPVDSVVFVVTTGTGLDVIAKDGFRLFPNPGQKGFTIQFSGNTMPLVRVVDFQGRIVREYLSVATDNFIDLSEVKSGAYIVEIYESGKLIATEKWVRN